MFFIYISSWSNGADKPSDKIVIHSIFSDLFCRFDYDTIFSLDCCIRLESLCREKNVRLYNHIFSRVLLSGVKLACLHQNQQKNKILIFKWQSWKKNNNEMQLINCSLQNPKKDHNIFSINSLLFAKQAYASQSKRDRT